jgi:general secretion pathway protein G
VTGKLRSAAGFTIIELMVVMALIVTLSTIAVVQYRHSVVYSKEAVLKEDLFRMKEAIDQYYADKNQYPATLDELVSSEFTHRSPTIPSPIRRRPGKRSPHRLIRTIQSRRVFTA